MSALNSVWDRVRTAWRRVPPGVHHSVWAAFVVNALALFFPALFRRVFHALSGFVSAYAVLTFIVVLALVLLTMGYALAVDPTPRSARRWRAVLPLGVVAVLLAGLPLVGVLGVAAMSVILGTSVALTAMGSWVIVGVVAIRARRLETGEILGVDVEHISMRDAIVERVQGIVPADRPQVRRWAVPLFALAMVAASAGGAATVALGLDVIIDRPAACQAHVHHSKETRAIKVTTTIEATPAKPVCRAKSGLTG